MGLSPDSPVGVFDSGIGGLSVLRALRQELPGEDFIYVADSGHAPYGERDAAHVRARALAITRWLIETQHIKALVVACNTATAIAIEELRQIFPQLPFIGVEPALKPAAQRSQNHRIGVMATRGTLASAKFQSLLASLHGQGEFVLQPCDGLADAIERGSDAQILALCTQHLQALNAKASAPIDTLVLGCTHYPFASAQLQALAGPQVKLIESGAPVARQTRRVLEAAQTLHPQAQGQVRLLATGAPENLQQAARHWLGLSQAVGAPDIAA
jgi:glutamate racemase